MDTNSSYVANIRKEPNGTVGNFYSKLKKKKGSAKAIVAASAKMLRIIYWVLKEHRPYHNLFNLNR